MSTATSPVILKSVKEFRAWRNAHRDLSVGFVPTMGALHAGHLDLVHRSLAQNDATVVSIFVNPAQFAPHEDLATYPKTFDTDLQKLIEAAEKSTHNRQVSAVLLPPVAEMYPSGISQNVNEQKGTFVEVKGYGHQMEGKSRPTFFRGVATVVTKLFNIVEPTHAYFGQKDIQQALLLRRLVSDLLLSHPTSENLHIIPTTRDPQTNLALSSRNAYLSPSELSFAPTLYQALRAGQEEWERSKSRQAVISVATDLIASRTDQASKAGVHIKLDYIEVNDPSTFEIVEEQGQKGSKASASPRAVIVSGALVVGKTRLIDNLICGDVNSIIDLA